MRHQLTTHPIRSLATLLGVAFVLFMISGIPVFRDAEGWNLADVIGYIAWFGFVLTALAFLISAVYVAVRGLRARSAA
jgi:hypothetical protein